MPEFTIISANAFLERKGGHRVQVQLKKGQATAYFYATVKDAEAVKSAQSNAHSDFKMYLLIKDAIAPELGEWLKSIE